MLTARLPRRTFLGMSLGGLVTLSPFGAMLARAAAPQPIYHLPFPENVVWSVIQGILSKGSHQGRAAYAWDFRMPTGSPIAAARAGTVWMLKQTETQHCNDLSCPDWNNYIVVDHGDGTSAAYLHGMQNGARVKVGQKVRQGQFMGLSDNTGQSGGPHLHFQVQYNNPALYLSQSFLIGFPEVPDSQNGVDGVPQVRKEYRSANEALLEFDIPNGHYYTETNGHGGGGGQGFSVVDDTEASMWTALQGSGGVDVAGYPISRRFSLTGSGQHVFQAFQKLVLDWDPSSQSTTAVNVMDLLHDAGLDQRLLDDREIPVAADFSAADRGRAWNDVMKAHLALLDGNKTIKAAYFSVPDPVERFGLPMSGVAEIGEALMLRTQRTVFQLWLHDMPWAAAGQVTLANAGELARDANLFGSVVFQPESLLPERMTGDLRLPWEIPGQEGIGFPLI